MLFIYILNVNALKQMINEDKNDFRKIKPFYGLHLGPYASKFYYCACTLGPIQSFTKIGGIVPKLSSQTDKLSAKSWI